MSELASDKQRTAKDVLNAVIVNAKDELRERGSLLDSHRKIQLTRRILECTVAIAFLDGGPFVPCEQAVHALFLRAENDHGNPRFKAREKDCREAFGRLTSAGVAA
jgi:hypothetical protein